MGKETADAGNYYHIYNRGTEKRSIFLNKKDYERFMRAMFLFQWGNNVRNIFRLSAKLEQPGRLLNILQDVQEQLTGERLVRIICFCLMPNHFHLLIEECAEGGVSKYMSRLGNSYTKYFNIKYERRGYLFGSAYHSVLIDENNYLLYLSRYIHRNPKEIIKGRGKLADYLWSSFYDYVIQNRWGILLEQNILKDQFDTHGEYKDYCEEGADIEITDEYLLDSQ
jgi:putative transposase